MYFGSRLADDPDPDDGFSYRQMMARDERRFKMADQDNDLKANKEEFTAFLHPEEYDHMKDIVVLVSNKRTLTQVLNNVLFKSLSHCLMCSFLPLGNHGRHRQEWRWFDRFRRVHRWVLQSVLHTVEKSQKQSILVIVWGTLVKFRNVLDQHYMYVY